MDGRNHRSHRVDPHAMGVRVTKEVLYDARDHVLFHLEPQTDVATAEDMAEYLTREFITGHDIAGCGKVATGRTDAGLTKVAPHTHLWLAQHGNPCVQQHYGNGIPLSTLEQTLALDAVTLEGARGAIREVLRSMASEDGMPIQTWPNERIDRLISGIAAFTDHPSPPMNEVADGCHQEMIRACPRCERTWRLAQNGILTSEDLVAPGVIARPEQQVRLLALHFHPDGRQHRKSYPEGSKHRGFLWVKTSYSLTSLVRKTSLIWCFWLQNLAPQFANICGTILTGTGRWSAHGLLGPLPSDAYQAVSHLTWGTVSSVGDLPAPLPAPPSSHRWWGLSASVSLFAALLCWFTFGAHATHEGVLSIDDRISP